ncbi:hypothetical protein U1Q18_052540 [Sarracenia purpurea var. burkii]
MTFIGNFSLCPWANNLWKLIMLSFVVFVRRSRLLSLFLIIFKLWSASDSPYLLLDFYPVCLPLPMILSGHKFWENGHYHLLVRFSVVFVRLLFLILVL